MFPLLKLFLDSGASSHMVASEGILQNPSPYLGSAKIVLGDRSKLPIKHSGSVTVPTSSSSLLLNNVLHVPSLDCNLISIQQLCADNHCHVVFTDSGVSIKDNLTEKVLLQCRSNGHLYAITLPQPRALTVNTHNMALWHRRLGHPHKHILESLRSRHLIPSFSFSDEFCISCGLGKSHQLPFNKVNHCSKSPLELIHADLWQSSIASNMGFRYYVIFVDDYSRYSWISPLVRKSDTFINFRIFKDFVEQNLGHKIKNFQCDGGKEFNNSIFTTFLQQEGISLRMSCPHTPQQNGVAERKHRHIIEMVRTLLIQSNLPSKFWVDAVFTSIFLINRLPSNTLGGISPFENLFGTIPSYSNLRVFGCLCFPNLTPYTSHKLESRLCTPL